MLVSNGRVTLTAKQPKTVREGGQDGLPRNRRNGVPPRNFRRSPRKAGKS